MVERVIHWIDSSILIISKNLAECVTTCASELGILADAKDQRIALSTIPCQVTSDEVLFRQALQNLVDNAIKFSREDSLVRVLVQHQDGHLHIKVSDEGRGIPSEAREHVFEPFFRVDREAPGAGLGLAISKRLAEAQNGTLQLDATGEIGVCFLLTLKSP